MWLSRPLCVRPHVNIYYPKGTKIFMAWRIRGHHYILPPSGTGCPGWRHKDHHGRSNCSHHVYTVRLSLSAVVNSPSESSSELPHGDETRLDSRDLRLLASRHNDGS